MRDATSGAAVTPGTGSDSGEPRPARGAGRPPRRPADRLPLAVLAAVALGACLLAYLQKAPCRFGVWQEYSLARIFRLTCYTDVYPLYFGERLSDGLIPYLDYPVEYPVLIGGVMQLAAWLALPFGGRAAVAFYDLTAILMALCAIIGVIAVAVAAGRCRRRDALLVALSPGLILAAFINWDLLAFALVGLTLAAWAARRPGLAGVALGLAVAAKFYPLFLLGPLLLVCLRAGRLRAFGTALAGAGAAWVAVNLPVVLAAPQGWSRFYTFSQERPADWGSIWYAIGAQDWAPAGILHTDTLNKVGALSFAVGCLLVAAIVLTAPRRPRLAQVCFLVVAAFLLTNKVWSPQFVIWLLPLVVLARPRLWSFAVWQLGEIWYFVAIWWYLLHLQDGATDGFAGIGAGWYFTALLARFGTVALLAGLVVADIYRPDRDVVRAGGADDPGGGVLDGAPDAFVLRRTGRAAPEAGRLRPAG